jgi:large subunit ribosomal protein L4
VSTPGQNKSADGQTPGPNDAEGPDAAEQTESGTGSATEAATATLTTARRRGYSAGEARRLARRDQHATASGETRTVTVHTPTGGTDGTAELPGELFDAPANTALMHQVVTAQLAAARQGTHDTKTRGEVRGGGRKPYRQKGTGRARQGSRSAPHYAGGGVVFGPHPRSYEQRLPRRMKRLALVGALSSKFGDGAIKVVSDLQLDEIKTKRLVGALSALGVSGRVLVVEDGGNETLERSARNLPGVTVIRSDSLNVVDVLDADVLLITAPAIPTIAEVYA